MCNYVVHAVGVHILYAVYYTVCTVLVHTVYMVQCTQVVVVDFRHIAAVALGIAELSLL